MENPGVRKRLSLVFQGVPCSWIMIIPNIWRVVHYPQTNHEQIAVWSCMWRCPRCPKSREAQVIIQVTVSCSIREPMVTRGICTPRCSRAKSAHISDQQIWRCSILRTKIEPPGVGRIWPTQNGQLKLGRVAAWLSYTIVLVVPNISRSCFPNKCMVPVLETGTLLLSI